MIFIVSVDDHNADHDADADYDADADCDADADYDARWLFVRDWTRTSRGYSSDTIKLRLFSR